MARPFSASEARRVLEEHRELTAALGAAAASAGGYRDEIKKAADALAADQVMALLRDIPVEELNRDKRGFRVKALRENGYESVADVAAASVYALAAVRGVSEEGARAIRQAAGDIAAQARQGVKLRLSADDRGPGSSRLVEAISKYKNSLPLAKACENLREASGRRIGYACADLSAGAGGIAWLFSSPARKQRALDAYRFLRETADGEYGQTVRALAARLRAVGQTTAEAAWRDFEENAVRFAGILEDAAPGLMGNDDAVCGLPEELALAVRDEELFPDGLLCELRRYQEWGVRYILRQERVLLGDEMGLGKTVQAIAAMVSLKNTGATHFLVVCPASVITNWCREIGEKSRLSVVKVHGTDRDAALASWLQTGGVAVTTYETTGHFALPEAFRFDMLVVDEAHYIKNPEARRTVNVKSIGSHAARLLFMTGTALENRVDEMIALVELLQPAVARRLRGMAALSAAPQFRKAAAPVYYRRRREDVLTELPELIESRAWCTLGPEEERVYERAVLEKRYADARRVSWSVEDMRLSSKAERMLELVEEAAGQGRKVIVFSFFLDTLQKAAALLDGRCMGPITGSVPPRQRQEIIDAFDEAPAGTVLAAQIQSGGTGLNIQSASVVILCEPQFKPSTENQAVSRAYRMGQTRNVLVYRLLCENTVDEKLISLLEQKQAVFDAFADESAAAEESLNVDGRAFGELIEEEIERISLKYGVGQDAPLSSV